MGRAGALTPCELALSLGVPRRQAVRAQVWLTLSPVCPMNPAKRSFVYPAAITFAFFALLLVFGSRRPSVIARVASLVPAPAVLPPSVVLTPPDTVAKPEDSAAGGAVQAVPVTQEVLRPSGPTDVVLSPEPPAPPAVSGVTRITSGWGPALGTGDGPGLVTATTAMLDAVPRVLAQASPSYPYAAKQAGRSGQVTVEFWVDPRGNVHDPRAVSATSSEFEDPAVRAVARWRFEPGRVNGRVVSFRMAVPVKFTVEP